MQGLKPRIGSVLPIFVASILLLASTGLSWSQEIGGGSPYRDGWDHYRWDHSDWDRFAREIAFLGTPGDPDPDRRRFFDRFFFRHVFLTKSLALQAPNRSQGSTRLGGRPRPQWLRSGGDCWLACPWAAVRAANAAGRPSEKAVPFSPEPFGEAAAGALERIQT